MKSGILAAETAYSSLNAASDAPADMEPYETAVKGSYIWDELKEVRNLRPSFHNPLGLWGGMAYSGLDSLILKGRVPWTLRNKWEDYAATKKARFVSFCVSQRRMLRLILMISEVKPIEYPQPDGILSFDILTSVSRTGTNHAENQPVHLRLPTDEGARERHTKTNVSGKQ